MSFIPGYGGGELRGKVNSSDWSVITGSRDKTMKLFDLQSGMEFRMFKGHVGRVLCCAITSQVVYDPVTHDPLKRTLVATGSWDRSIKIWDLETKEIYHDLGGPDETNTSPNSAGHQNTVQYVWGGGRVSVCVVCVCVHVRCSVFHTPTSARADSLTLSTCG